MKIKEVLSNSENLNSQLYKLRNLLKQRIKNEIKIIDHTKKIKQIISSNLVVNELSNEYYKLIYKERKSNSGYIGSLHFSNKLGMLSPELRIIHYPNDTRIGKRIEVMLIFQFPAIRKIDFLKLSKEFNYVKSISGFNKISIKFEDPNSINKLIGLFITKYTERDF